MSLTWKEFRNGDEDKALISGSRQERTHVSYLYAKCVQERRKTAAELFDKAQSSTSADLVKLDSYKEYKELKEAAEIFRSAMLSVVDEDVQFVKRPWASSYSSEATVYENVADWAQVFGRGVQSTLRQLMGVAFIGATIVYTTMFTATRGSIGLMAWAFGLYSSGISLLIALLGSLGFLSKMGHIEPSWVKSLEIGYVLGISLSSYFILAASFITVFTVFKLDYVGTSTERDDAPLVFNVLPRNAAIVALVFIAVLVAVVIIEVVLSGSMGNNLTPEPYTLNYAHGLYKHKEKGRGRKNSPTATPVDIEMGDDDDACTKAAGPSRPPSLPHTNPTPGEPRSAHPSPAPTPPTDNGKQSA